MDSTAVYVPFFELRARAALARRIGGDGCNFRTRTVIDFIHGSGEAVSTVAVGYGCVGTGFFEINGIERCNRLHFEITTYSFGLAKWCGYELN